MGRLYSSRQLVGRLYSTRNTMRTTLINAVITTRISLYELAGLPSRLGHYGKTRLVRNHPNFLAWKIFLRIHLQPSHVLKFNSNELIDRM